MKSYLLEMPKELHAELKALAALKGISMKDLILKTIEDKVKDENKK